MWYHYSYMALNIAQSPRCTRVDLKQQKYGCTEGHWKYHELNMWVTIKKMETKSMLLLNIKKQLKFIGHIRWKEGLESSILTGHIEGTEGDKA